MAQDAAVLQHYLTPLQACLEPAGVTLYTSFDEMLAHPGLEAVIVSGITTEHARHQTRRFSSYVPA